MWMTLCYLLLSSLPYHNLQTSCSFIVTYFTFNIDVFILTHYPIQWKTDCKFLKFQFHHTITELEWIIGIKIDLWLAFYKSCSGIMTVCNAQTHTHTHICCWIAYLTWSTLLQHQMFDWEMHYQQNMQWFMAWVSYCQQLTLHIWIPKQCKRCSIDAQSGMVFDPLIYLK